MPWRHAVVSNLEFRISNLISISIIIINYNGEKFLENCLNSVLTETREPFEIILVDNNSKDKSLTLLKEKFGNEKRLKVIALPKNLGPAKGRNIAAKETSGKYLVFLDYDTIVDKNWLSKTVPFFEQNPDVGAGQLKILQMGTNIYDSAGEKLTPFGFLAERARGAGDRGQFDKVEDIFSGKTAAMVVRKDVFEKVSGFDEDFFMYWEEPDLCWRIWKTGFRVVFLPMGKVWHAYGTKNKKVSREHDIWITYQGCRNQIATIIKNRVGLRGLQMFISAICAWVLLMSLFLLKLDWQKTKAVLQAFCWDAKNAKLFLRKRKELQKNLGERYYSDRTWMSKVLVKQGITWYIGKGISFVLGKPF